MRLGRCHHSRREVPPQFCYTIFTLIMRGKSWRFSANTVAGAAMQLGILDQRCKVEAQTGQRAESDHGLPGYVGSTGGQPPLP